MDNFNLHGFFKKQYLTEGDINVRPYDLQDHSDIKIFTDTLSKMLNINIEQSLGSGRYNGREGYYIKMPRQIMYWDRDQDKIKVEAIFDKINKLTKEYEFELNDLTDYDEEPGERSWPANIGFFVKEKENINEASIEDYRRVSAPRAKKDKNNPNFLNVFIDYDIGPGGATMAFGQETMTGQIRRLSSERARLIMNNIATMLQNKYDVEDIEVTDLENGKVKLFAVSDDFIDMKGDEFGDFGLPGNLQEMDMNDPVMMKIRAAKMKADKLAKMRAANAGDDGNDKFFDNAKKIAFLKKEREQLMRDMEQEAEPEGGPIADEYGSKLNRIDAAIAKLSGRKEMTYDQAIAEMKVGDKVTFKSGGDDMEIIDVRDMFASDLKAYRVKNAKGETFEYSEDQLQLAENETYASSFGGFRKELDGETIENELQAKGYETPPTGIWNKILVKKNGERVAMIDTNESFYTKDGKSYQWSGTEKFIDHVESLNESASTEEKRIAMRAIKSIAKYRGVSEDEARRDLMRAAEELGSLKEAIEDIKETIELGKNLTEELCAKGKAYRKKRMAAGEKSSAYLNGRAVKVCKGQMKG